MSLNLPYPTTAMQGLQSRYHSLPTLSEGEPLAVDHRPGSTPHHLWPRLHPMLEIIYSHGQTFGNAVPDCAPGGFVLRSRGPRGAGGDPKDLIC